MDEKYEMIKSYDCGQEIYSVRHALINCVDLGLIRPRFYTVPDMKTLFDIIIPLLKYAYIKVIR